MQKNEGVFLIIGKKTHGVLAKKTKINLQKAEMGE